MSGSWTLALALAAALLPASLAAQEGGGEPVLGISLSGEQDLPKVLYIVPWKDAELGDPPPPPRVQLDEALLTPVNRDAFRQRLRDLAGASRPAPGGERASDIP